MSAAETLSGQCHCGSVQFEVVLTDGLKTARRCTCSYCRMRGAVVISAEVGGLTITKGADILALYRFNTGTAKHYFCSKCGIYTHHQRRSNQNQFGVNAACLEGVSPFDFANLPVMDGVNHPSDHKGGGGVAGHLLFICDDSGG
jgi:hypothetical protein